MTDRSSKVNVLMVTGPGDGEGIGDYTAELIEYISDAKVETLTVPQTDDPIDHLTTALHVGTAPHDVVHVQHEYGLFGSLSLMSWFFFPLVYLLCWIRDVSVVVTIHEALNGQLVSAPLKMLKRLYVQMLNECITIGADHVIFLSERCAEKFVLSVKPDTYSVLSHGVNPSREVGLTNAEAKRRLGYHPTDTVVSEPGYVEPRKGNDTLIDLAERLPQYEFLIAGGPPSETYEEYFESIRSQAPDNLRVTGRLPEEEFHTSFVASDLVILPYRNTEQGGIVNALNQSGILSRCAAYQKPVVTSDLEHFRQVNNEWKNLLTQDFTDITATVKRIERILGDDETRERLSENMHVYAEQNSYSTVAAKHVQIYRNLTDTTVGAVEEP